MAPSGTRSNLGTAVDEASAASAAPASSRRWRRATCRDRVRDRFGSPARLTKQGTPAASCLDKTTLGHPKAHGLLCVPQRFPEPCSPTVSAARPSQSRLGAPSGGRAGRPAQTSPLTRAGRFTSRLGQEVVRHVAGHASCVVADVERRPHRPGASSFRRWSALGTETPSASPVLEGWATSTFSRAEQPYRRCSAAPHLAPSAFLGKPRGLPRLNDPPHAGGAAPSPKIRARRGAVLGPTMSWGRPVRRHATSQRRSRASPPDWEYAPLANGLREGRT